MEALVQLYTSVDAASNMPQPDGSSILMNATTAKGAVKRIAQKFDPDRDVKLDQRASELLEAPIASAELLVRGLAPKELNSKAAGLCAQIGPVLSKFPFNPASDQDATPQDINQVLKPESGVIWAFVNDTLKGKVNRLGNQFTAVDPIINPGYLAFLNHAARWSEAFYRQGPDPKLTYTVRPMKSDGIEGLTLTIDGQTLNADAGQAKPFTWPGTGQGARLAGKLAGGADLVVPSFPGSWGGLRLFASADKLDAAGGGYNAEWFLKFGGRNQGTVRFALDTGGAPITLKGPGLRCTSQVAK
jgi:type VI protein secretion system component VasK